jgi:hypothetical protein
MRSDPVATLSLSSLTALDAKSENDLDNPSKKLREKGFNLSIFIITDNGRNKARGNQPREKARGLFPVALIDLLEMFCSCLRY